MPKNVLEYTRHLFDEPDREWGQHHYINAGRDGQSEVVNNGDIEPSVSRLSDYEVLHDFICNCLSSYYHEFPSSFSPTRSHVRFNRYTENQLMKPHTDHITSLFDGRARGIPVLSLVGLINKAEEGGEFFMNLLGERKEYLKESGELIIFPSVFIYEHEVQPVRKGVRDSFVSWTYF